MGRARGAVNGPKAEGKYIVLNWKFTDTNESFVTTLENSALTYIEGGRRPPRTRGSGSREDA